MENENRKRVWIFLGFAFGISWATGLVIYLTGGLDNSPVLNFAGTPVSLAFLLLSTAYMFGPALANILTRLLTKEGAQSLMLEPHFDRGRWAHFLAAWFLPGVLTLIGMALFFLFFPRFYDPNLTMLRNQLAAQSGGSAANPWLVVVVQVLQAMLIAPLLNAVATFGEEFGWRGYLLPKLLPLGSHKAVLLIGLIWGVWHWPVILMGYNYGVDYFGAPFLGPLAMVGFTLSLSVFFAWLIVKGDSVWPAVIAHGALNGIASVGLLFVQSSPSSLLGPAPTGIVGGLGFALIALVLLLIPGALRSNPSKMIARPAREAQVLPPDKDN